MQALIVQRMSLKGWIIALLTVALAYVAFHIGIEQSADAIWTRPEYGHGMLIPFIAAFLVWQRRDELGATCDSRVRGSASAS